MAKDIIGKKFGYLTIEKCVYEDAISKKCKYLCCCDCGNKKILGYSALVKNKSISCGCKNKKPVPINHSLPRNVVGERYGSLIVLNECEPHITPNGSKQRIVNVKCDCGNVFETRLSAAQKTQKCRMCAGKERRVDITGKKYGMLTVISMADDYISPSGVHLSRCKCICECGNETIVNMSGLVSGTTKSCGCLNRTAGLLKDIPSLARKYDYEKNEALGLEFNKLTARTSRKIWWKCEDCGNSWFATIASQNDKIQHGCPYCSGRLVIKGKNDLESQFPEIAEEWDYDKNKEFAPDSISCKSGIKIWWRCNEGHSWKASVGNRTHNKSCCPQCNIENVNSFCEQAVYFYVKQAFPDSINSDYHLGVELDIYIPSKKVAIEYDGEAWHKTSKRLKNDEKKGAVCFENNITLIRIREPKLQPVDNCISFIREDSTTDLSLEKVIEEVLFYLGVNINVDIASDTSKILAQYATKKYEKSLAFCSPGVAKEWHPTKNAGLTPDKVSNSGRRKVWWKCNKGHEWQMNICDRTRQEKFYDTTKRVVRAQGCPFCSGKRVLKGFNDLATIKPEIAKEWHPLKNGDIHPTDVTCGTNHKYWWRCQFGHEWYVSVNSRCRNNSVCPVCFEQKRSPALKCVETQKVYTNAKMACEDIGYKSPSSLYKCCRGEAKTAGGYHWEYTEMEEV